MVQHFRRQSQKDKLPYPTVFFFSFFSFLYYFFFGIAGVIEILQTSNIFQLTACKSCQFIYFKGVNERFSFSKSNPYFSEVLVNSGQI